VVNCFVVSGTIAAGPATAPFGTSGTTTAPARGIDATGVFASGAGGVGCGVDPAGGTNGSGTFTRDADFSDESGGGAVFGRTGSGLKGVRTVRSAPASIAAATAGLGRRDAAGPVAAGSLGAALSAFAAGLTSCVRARSGLATLRLHG
jgi:hypothetical protein